MAADAEYLPRDDDFWGPSLDYGIQAAGHGYVLNNTIHSDPPNFFGRRSNTPSQVSQAVNLLQLRSNLSAQSPDEQPLSAIWMICNLDGENYDASSTAGGEFSVSPDVQTPWRGRHFVFFDGHLEFLNEGSYPSRD